MNDDKIREVKDILEKELDPTTALNIILSAVKITFDDSRLNELDRALISKALMCFSEKVELGENFTINVK